MVLNTTSIDSKGRIFVPKKIKEQLFKDCSTVEYYIDGQSLIIKKKQSLNKEAFMERLKDVCTVAMTNKNVAHGIDFSKYDDVEVALDRRHNVVLTLKSESIDKVVIHYSELCRQVVEYDDSKPRQRHVYNAYEYLSKIQYNKLDASTICVEDHVTLDMIETVLVDGFAISAGFSDVDINVLEYHEAKQKLIEWLGMNEDDLTYELVQAQMLADGHSLIVTDEDGDEHALTLVDIVNAMKKYCKGNMLMLRYDMNFGNYDSNDFNNILQIAIFGEVIYG